MHWVQKNGLTYLQFPALAVLEGLFHGIFLRHASNPHGQPAPFNLALDCGTPHGQVERNRQWMLETFGRGLTGVYAHQVHGTEVGIWNARVSRAAFARIEADALVSARSAGALVIQTADCQAVIVIDPVKRVVANIHCGWRGSIGNIIARTIETVTAEYACRPHDLVCGIGPSLGPCCAEFIHYRQEIPQSFWRYRRSGDYFDFWQISTDQLINSGVLPRNISAAGICTKCNQHHFFSHRGERQTGRFAAVVGIHPLKGNRNDATAGYVGI